MLLHSPYRCRNLCCGGQEASWTLESLFAYTTPAVTARALAAAAWHCSVPRLLEASQAACTDCLAVVAARALHKRQTKSHVSRHSSAFNNFEFIVVPITKGLINLLQLVDGKAITWTPVEDVRAPIDLLRRWVGRI